MIQILFIVYSSYSSVTLVDAKRKLKSEERREGMESTGDEGKTL